MQRRALVLAAACLVACGARTTLSVGEDAGTRRDAAPPDASRSRDAGVPDGGRAEPCRRDADCASGVCRAPIDLRARDLAPFPLVCGSVTEGAAWTGAPCEDRDECNRGICALSGHCVAPCVTDDDCGERDRCQQVYVVTSPAAMQPLNACVAIFAAPESVRIEGPTPGPSIPGGFDETAQDLLPSLSEGALIVWTTEQGSSPFLREVSTRGADASIVYDAFRMGPDEPAPAWGASPRTIADVVTLLYPNGPGTPVSADGFEARLGAIDATSSTRTLLSRTLEGTTVDLDVYVVGVDRWSRPGPVPADLREGFAELDAIYRSVGLTLGDVRLHRATGDLADRLSILEGDGEFPPELLELYELSAGARRPSVHVFMVRVIDGALGIASGIPGPHAMPGTAASGIAISADLLGDASLGIVLAHEIGHFMGLFHTSEADGAVNDPFPDTLACRTEQDLDFDGFLAPDECVDHGAHNVMFWAAGGAELSPSQGSLMRRAYFVR